jgi:iron complex outermembrane receptor protein
MKKCLLLVVFCALTILSVIGQSLKKISGRVTDDTHKPVALATIHLLNTTQYAVSNSNGDFFISNVVAGNYDIEVSATGFATIVKTITDGDNVVNILLPPYTAQLETITVTADKRESLLQKQPSSVTAITSKQVLDYRLWNIKDIAGIVPGLYAGQSGDDRSVTSIRGIATTSYDPAVATYVDGVNQFTLDTYIPQLNDIERIEVLRGPQGTLYGRNAMGGVINIITKQPTNTASGFAEINIGNYNQQRYSGGFKVPLVKNKLFFGASALYNGRDGFYTNDFTKKTYDKQHSFTGNYYLKYLPSASWLVTLNIKHQDNINNGPFPLVFGVANAFKNPFHLKQNAIATMHDNTVNGSLSIQHFGNKFNFSSQTAYQNNYRYYDKALDGDFSPLDAITIFNNYGKKWNKVSAITEELRVNSTAVKTSALTWTAGAYLFHQLNPSKQATHYGADAGVLGSPVTNASSIITSKGNNNGLAVYGQLNYAVSKTLVVFGGLRYDYEHRSLSVKGEFQPDGAGAVTTTPDTAASTHFNAISPKLGLQYQYSSNSNIYASYSRGFRTGGLTQLSGDPSQPPLYPYSPEYSSNFEVGIKNNLLNNKLCINAAAFLTYVSNAQVPTLVLPDAITVTRNTGTLHSKGVELELSATPFKGFSLDYAAGYTDAAYKSLKVSSNGQAVDLNGKKQIFTPDLTSMLAAQYAFTINEARQFRLILRGEYFYFGQQYFDLANTIRQSAYNLLNARAGVSIKHAEIFLWARNLSDTNYIEYAYDFGAVHLAAPRTFGVTLRASF